MSPSAAQAEYYRDRFPRSRGDEPPDLYLSEEETVFPAHAGMSPWRQVGPMRSLSFPRSRGDEPPEPTPEPAPASFSPLTRG